MRKYGWFIAIGFACCIAYRGSSDTGTPAASDAAESLRKIEERSELNKTFAEAFSDGVREATTYENVVQNDYKRFNNLEEFYPEVSDRFQVIVDFVNMLRPANENELLFRHIDELLSLPESSVVNNEIMSFFSDWPIFSTDDKRLWSAAKRTIEREREICSEYKLRDVEWALGFMGMCRVAEAPPYLLQATKNEFWQGLSKTAPFKYGSLINYDRLRCKAVLGIRNLSMDVAIGLLEGLQKELATSDPIYETTWRALDEVWRRKHGDLPLFNNNTRFLLCGEGYEFEFPTAYPEWIYGIGGKKIEWPFGKPPKGYVIPRIEVEF